MVVGRSVGLADDADPGSLQPSIALRYFELDLGAGLEEILVREEIVGVYENVFLAAVRCDEPVPAHLIEPHNAACRHSFHFTRIHEPPR